MDTVMDSSVTWEGVAVEMLAAESSKLQALMADPGTSADTVKVELCSKKDFDGCAAEAEDLSEDNNGATDTAVQLSAVQEEAARLRRLLAGKARQVSALQAELTSARQSEASASAAQQQLKQQLAAALAAGLPKAEEQSSKGQLGELAQLQQQLQGLQEQLEQARQHEAAAIADKAAAQQIAAMLTGQVRSVAKMD
uniref:Uncharacterized protein n=1 Tax=Tetradesmus obliquus TaxID=3088 RepID=A0A383VBG8_TETOB|eukprot:jgi/Sobl393_1/6560/SZX62293.1